MAVARSARKCYEARRHIFLSSLRTSFFTAPPGLFPVPILSAGSILITLIALIGVAVVASLVPALRVRRMDVSAALRTDA